MQDEQQLVKILTGYKIFIGKMVSESEHSLTLTDCCDVIVTPSAIPGKINFNFHKINGEVIIKGNMVIYEFTEEDELFKAYIQTITGIVPVNVADMARLNRKTRLDA